MDSALAWSVSFEIPCRSKSSRGAWITVLGRTTRIYEFNVQRGIGRNTLSFFLAMYFYQLEPSWTRHWIWGVNWTQEEFVWCSSVRTVVWLFSLVSAIVFFSVNSFLRTFEREWFPEIFWKVSISIHNVGDISRFYTKDALSVWTVYGKHF